MTYHVAHYMRRSPNELSTVQNLGQYCRDVFKMKYGEKTQSEVFTYYIDVCEMANTADCPQMIRLLRDCMKGKVDLVVVETSYRAAKNVQTLFFWMYFILHLGHHVEIAICDTIHTRASADRWQNVMLALENLVSSAADEYARWKQDVLAAIEKMDESEIRNECGEKLNIFNGKEPDMIDEDLKPHQIIGG